jgi:Tol biopolymer transport system component
VAALPIGNTYMCPRWSPDDREIAFQWSTGYGFDTAVEIASVATGERREVARSESLMGFCWRPDGSGLIYSSSQGSTVLYPPVMNLRQIGRDSTGDRQTTFGDQSFVEPDAHPSGSLLVSRTRRQSDIWRFPVGGSAAENTREAMRVTRQTGNVQTPSVSPDDREVVYLSDNGGHGNLWVARTDGSSPRQITFERDPAVAIGVPKWSPAGDCIVFLVTRNGRAGLSAIRPDGSNFRTVVAHGLAPGWSPDGRLLYYLSLTGPAHLEKIPIDGGDPVVVRDDDGELPQLSPDGSTLYYVQPMRSESFGRWGADWEIRMASPESAPGEVLVRVPHERTPGLPPISVAALSPDGQSIAIALLDGATTNLWVQPTAGGAMRQVTDFGDRQVTIARSICWSPDSQSIYAAVAESETDIVLFDGMM